jgi:hypothetical protein
LLGLGIPFLITVLDSFITFALAEGSPNGVQGNSIVAQVTRDFTLNMIGAAIAAIGAVMWISAVLVSHGEKRRRPKP